MQHNHENFLRGGGVSKECSDVSTTMNVFTSLPNFMSCALLVFLKNAGVRQKKGFMSRCLQYAWIQLYPHVLKTFFS